MGKKYKMPLFRLRYIFCYKIMLLSYEMQNHINKDTGVYIPCLYCNTQFCYGLYKLDYIYSSLKLPFRGRDGSCRRC